MLSFNQRAVKLEKKKKKRRHYVSKCSSSINREQPNLNSNSNSNFNCNRNYNITHTASTSSMLLDSFPLAVEIIVSHPPGQLGGFGTVEPTRDSRRDTQWLDSPLRLRQQTESVTLNNHCECNTTQCELVEYNENQREKDREERIEWMNETGKLTKQAEEKG